MMAQRIAIAFGAGAVSALLFAVSAKGTLSAVALAYLSPLPIVIAGLNWGVDMGGIAALTACGGVAAFADIASTILFGVVIALPIWILTTLSSIDLRSFYRAKNRTDGSADWFPLGGVVTAGALIAVAIGLGAIALLILIYDGYEKGVQALADQYAPSIQTTIDQVLTLPAGMTVREFAALVVREAPPMLALLMFLVLCANLYLGARVAQISSALKPPWRDLPEALILPRLLGLLGVLCLGLGFAVEGPVRLAAWTVAGVIAAAFALQGLALAHALTRGLKFRNPLLVALYLACALLSQWIVPAVAFVGLIESFLSLRAWRLAAVNAKPSN
jgi:predicted membrane protein DUF2232